jgi:hypothetical protein
VLALTDLEREPAALEPVDVERPAVEPERVQADRLDVQEGAPRPAGEPDRGRGDEARLVRRQVQRREAEGLGT